MNEKNEKLFFFLICLLYFIVQVVFALLFGLTSTGDLRGLSLDKLLSSENVYQTLKMTLKVLPFVLIWWFFIRKKE